MTTEADRPAVGDGPPRLRLGRAQWALIAAFGVLFAIGCRTMHLNADSLHYIDMARTLIEDHTIATWNLTLTAEHVPKIESLWPPMYAILLAGPMALGISGKTATAIVAVGSLTGMLALMMAVARRIEWGILTALLLLYMTFSHGVAFRAFSETPFIALSFAALIAMALALQNDAPRWWRSRAVWLGLMAGVLAACAVLTRHVGFVLIPALGLMALFAPLSHMAEPLKTRVAAIAGLAVGAGPPLVLWFARYSMAGAGYFGPERPPSQGTIVEMLRHAAQGIYVDATLPLLVLIAALLGYHLLTRDGEPRWRSFALAIALGATLFAVFHEVGTTASHMMYRMDNPPEGRQFFPGYAALLLIAAALMSLAWPPQSGPRWRWPIIAVAALPILGGPLLAASVAHDLTPVYSQVDQWVADNTSPHDLVIGWRAWTVRYHTGRPVLQSGMVTEPSVYDGAAVAKFLDRFGSEFTGAWLLAPVGRPDADRAVHSYEAAGLHLGGVAELDVGGVYHYGGIDTILVYRVTGWQMRCLPPGGPGGRRVRALHTPPSERRERLVVVDRLAHAPVEREVLSQGLDRREDLIDAVHLLLGKFDLRRPQSALDMSDRPWAGDRRGDARPPPESLGFLACQYSVAVGVGPWILREVLLEPIVGLRGLLRAGYPHQQ